MDLWGKQRSNFVFPQPAEMATRCHGADGGAHLGKLLEGGIKAIHSTNDRLHAGRIRQSNMLDTPKRLTGNYCDLELLQEVVCKIGRSEDGSAWTLLPEQSTYIGKRIKCSGGHSAANAGHRIQALDHHAPPPIELSHHLRCERTTFAQGHDGGLLRNGTRVRCA